MADFVKLNNNATQVIYRYSGFTSTIKDTFLVDSLGSGTPVGLECSGGTLYLSNGTTGNTANVVFKMVGFSGVVADSFQGIGTTDITLVDGDVLSVEYAGTKVYHYSGFSPVVIDSWSVGGNISGLAYDGTNLLGIKYPSGPVYRYAGVSGTVTDTFDAGWLSWGITWDGTNVIVDNVGSATQYTGFGGAIITSFNTPHANGAIGWLTEDVFTVSFQYKQAGGAYANATSALGDVGANIGVGSKTAYWDDPGQDRANVEISDAQVQLTLVPDANNEGTHSVNVTSAAQLSAGDGTGAQGDVKVEYEIS